MKPLEDTGVRIYVVNIGAKPDKEETKDIVPDVENVFTPKTTDEVPALAPDIVNKLKEDTNDRKFQLHSFRPLIIVT